MSLSAAELAALEALEAESRATAIIAVTMSFLGLATVFVGLRVFVRGHLQKIFALDDWFMVLSYISFIITATFVALGVYDGGLGQHVAVVKVVDGLETIESGLKYILLNEIFYVMAVGCFKNSIAIMELRLGMGKACNAILWTSIVLTVASTIFLIFFLIFRCYPVSRAWQIEGEGTCMSQRSLIIAVYFFSGFDIALDWIYAILPIPMILKLHMAPAMKVSVISVLSLGVIASVATLIRIKFVEDILDVTDPLFSFSGLIIWSMAEVGLGIMTGCASTLRPLLRAIGIVSSTNTNQRSRSYNLKSTTHSQAQRSRAWNASAMRSQDPYLVEEDHEMSDGRHRVVVGSSKSSAMDHVTEDSCSEEQRILANGQTTTWNGSHIPDVNGDWGHNPHGIAMTVDFSVQSEQRIREPHERV